MAAAPGEESSDSIMISKYIIGIGGRRKKKKKISGENEGERENGVFMTHRRLSINGVALRAGGSISGENVKMAASAIGGEISRNNNEEEKRNQRKRKYLAKAAA